MGQVLIRNLDDSVLASLRLKAELSGKSFEQELRDILTDAAPMTPDELVSVSRRLRSAFPIEELDTHSAVRWGRDDESVDREAKPDAL